MMAFSFTGFAQHTRHMNPDYQLPAGDTSHFTLQQYKYYLPGDSLNSNQLQAYKDSLQHLLSPVSNKQDSLMRLSQSSTTSFNQTKNQKLDSLQQKLVPTAPHELQQELSTADSRFADQQPGGDIAGDVPSVQQATDLPQPNMMGDALPTMDALPSATLPSAEGTLPDPLSKTPISSVQQQTAPLQQGMDQADTYKQGLSQKNIDQTLDSQAGQIEQLQPLQQQFTGLPQSGTAVPGTAVPGTFDPKVAIPGSNGLPAGAMPGLKQQAFQKATNHFVKHPQALTNAQGKLARYKRRQPELPAQATAGKPLSQRPANPMKGQPLQVRLRPGMMLHFQKGTIASLDFSPQLSYRLTGRITVGAGSTYRVYFRTERPFFPGGPYIYGGRVFTDYIFWKNLFVHAELESLRRPGGISLMGDRYQKDWVESIPLGLGKQFNIGKRIQANTQMLYNVITTNYSPYHSQWLFRMGFTLLPKTKAKKDEVK